MQIEDLFRQYADDVFTFLVYWLKDRSLAEDVTQETFIKAMRSIEQGKVVDRPLPWLLTIGKRTAVDALRKHKRRATVPVQNLEPSADGSNAAEVIAESKIATDQLLDVFEELKSEYRQVVVCRAVMDMTSEETAQLLGWTPNRVRVTLHRALKAARQELTKRGWSHDISR